MFSDYTNRLFLVNLFILMYLKFNLDQYYVLHIIVVFTTFRRFTSKKRHQFLNWKFVVFIFYQIICCKNILKFFKFISGKLTNQKTNSSKFIKFTSLVIYEIHLIYQVYRFKCQVCGKGFKRNRNLRGHMVVHSNGNPHKYQCHHCNRTFGQKESLNGHLWIHGGSQTKPIEGTDLQTPIPSVTDVPTTSSQSLDSPYDLPRHW